MNCPTCHTEYCPHYENTHCPICEGQDYLVEEHMINARRIGKEEYLATILKRLSEMTSEERGGMNYKAMQQVVEELEEKDLAL